jgi:hypothetical protein
MDELDALLAELELLESMLYEYPKVPALFIVSNEEEILDIQLDEEVEFNPWNIENILMPCTKAYVAHHYGSEYSNAELTVMANANGILVGAHLTS